MKNDLPDEKFDQLMRQLLNDAALDESQVNDIADSPAIWWGVQRRVNEQKAAKSPWPPVRPWKRWLMIGIPAAAAVVLGITLMIDRAPVTAPDVAKLADVAPAASTITPQYGESGPTAAISVEPIRTPTRFTRHQAATRAVAIAKQAKTKADNAGLAVKKSEIKTDFIALTYARDPDSGQIIRVKVPSSMMVTLGVVATVKKPTDMVDAEVLVGDDGLTRAIRFIH